MIQHGINPVRWHFSDYDFHRTFGTVSKFPSQLNLDAGFGMPNQNEYNDVFAFPALPMGCTGYTQSEVCQDADGVQYDPSFTYDQTLLAENKQRGQGCDVRDSLNSTITWGLKAKGDTDQKQAFARHRGQYFTISEAPDYFDGIRSAISIARRSVSMATPWFPEWHAVSKDGIMSMPNLPKLSLFGSLLSHIGLSALGNYYDTLPWHNYKCSGFTMTNTSGQYIRNGEVFLMMKSWQGLLFGDNGWCYMPMDVVNAVLDVPGTGAFTLAKADPTNIKNVEFNLTSLIENLMLRLPKQTPMNADKLYNAAKDSLGTHQTLNENVPPEVGCAEAFSSVAKKGGVPGIPVKGFAGTAELYDWLHGSALFQPIAAPEPGAVIISPTGHGNGSVRGHVGICAKYGTQYVDDFGICSNDSNSGLFREQWSYREWVRYYGQVGQLPVDIFRFKG